MAARTGVPGNSAACSASITIWWPRPGNGRACSRIDSSDTCSPTIRTSRRKRPTSGLYLNPPDHAVVFAVDEKTAIQALDRLDPVLPLSPGRAERHGFAYYRHGTLSLFAALNTQSGEVVGHTVARHTSAEFVGFLQTVVEKIGRAHV